MAAEQTLFVYREVDLYKIPPRPAAGGHRSGDWRVSDKIFTARCKVVAVGESLEVRLEDPNSGELFGVCPIPRGQLSIAVENATDSSRNFVLRLEDAATKRHAFIGMSFGDRSAAFDFNVSLTDHERRLQREVEFNRIHAAADPLAAAQQVLPEAAAMYRHQDLSLKEGETIRIAVKKPGSSNSSHAAEDGSSGGGGFLSRLGNLAHPPASSNSSSTASGAPRLVALAPPPADLSAGAARRAPPAATHAAKHAAAPPAVAAAKPAQPGPAVDLLGLDFFGPGSSSSGGGSSSAAVQSAVAAFDNFQPFAEQQQQQQQAPKPAPQPAAEPGWATFE